MLNILKETEIETEIDGYCDVVGNGWIPYNINSRKKYDG
jgi:hypothetical protein